MKRIEYWLLSLYPRAWRKRYEEEFVALLEQYTPSWRDLLDIFFCALHEQIFTLLRKGNAMLHQQRTDTFIFRLSFVLASLLVLGMVITGMVLVRAELLYKNSDFNNGLTSCAILTLYIVAGWCAPYFTKRSGVRYAGVFGLIAGVVFLFYVAIDTLGNPDATFDTVLLNSTLITTSLLCFVAGLLTTRTTRNIVTGLLVGMWTAMIAVLIGAISLGVITTLFTDTITHGTLFYQDYLNSGVQIVTDYAILYSLSGFRWELTILPVGGAILGALGSVLGMSLVRQQVQL